MRRTRSRLRIRHRRNDQRAVALREAGRAMLPDAETFAKFYGSGRDFHEHRSYNAIPDPPSQPVDDPADDDADLPDTELEQPKPPVDALGMLTLSAPDAMLANVPPIMFPALGNNDTLATLLGNDPFVFGMDEHQTQLVRDWCWQRVEEWQATHLLAHAGFTIRIVLRDGSTVIQIRDDSSREVLDVTGVQ